MSTTSTAGDAAPSAPLDPTEFDYLAAVLEDEIALARLLRWSNVEAPRTLVPNFWLWGTRAGETGLAARLARTYLPRWRRCWSSAGELIGRCGLSVMQVPGAVIVMARAGVPVYARMDDFPTMDDAIRYAMVKASIAYLEAGRAEQAAWNAQELNRLLHGAAL